MQSAKPFSNFNSFSLSLSICVVVWYSISVLILSLSSIIFFNDFSSSFVLILGRLIIFFIRCSTSARPFSMSAVVIPSIRLRQETILSARSLSNINSFCLSELICFIVLYSASTLILFWYSMISSNKFSCSSFSILGRFFIISIRWATSSKLISIYSFKVKAFLKNSVLNSFTFSFISLTKIPDIYSPCFRRSSLPIRSSNFIKSASLSSFFTKRDTCDFNALTSSIYSISLLLLYCCFFFFI